MLKTITTHDKIIIEKTIELPVDIAVEVLTCYCNKTNRQCVLVGINNEEPCPFTVTRCTDITKEMWEEYLNE